MGIAGPKDEPTTGGDFQGKLARDLAGRDDTRKGDSVDKEGSEEEEPSYLGPAADEALPGVLPGGQVLGELALEVAVGGGLSLGPAMPRMS